MWEKRRKDLAAATVALECHGTGRRWKIAIGLRTMNLLVDGIAQNLIGPFQHYNENGIA